MYKLYSQRLEAWVVESYQAVKSVGLIWRCEWRLSLHSLIRVSDEIGLRGVWGRGTVVMDVVMNNLLHVRLHRKGELRRLFIWLQ